MSSSPTRPTLLLRLRESGDEESWAEFVEIYTPLVHRYCLNRGLQPADADDIVQDVMRSLFRALRDFHYDPARGSFRSWLYTVTRHEVNRHLKRLSKLPRTGNSTTLVLKIEETPDPREERDWDLEYRRQMFAWAAESIRAEFSETHWQAFTRTTLDGADPAEVGEELGLSRAAVYIAKSRIVKRLRDKISSVAAESWESTPL